MACPLTQIVPPRRGWWVTPRRRRVVDHLPSTSGPAALTTRGTAWARTALTRAARRRHIFQRREGTTPAAGPDTACPLGANRVLSADGTRAVGGRARAGSPTQGRAARAAGWDQRRRGVGPGRTQATTNGPAPPLGRCRAGRWREIRRSAEVRLVALAEVQFLQRDGLAAFGDRTVVDLVVAEARVDLGLGRLGRLDLNVAVPGQAGSGRDQLTEDDVLLQTQQGIGASAHRGLGEHLGGLLERGRRQPRVGGQRCLGDPHQFGTTGGGLAALGHHAAVLVLEDGPVGQFPGQQPGVAGVEDGHPPQHLAHDDLDVLVVDVHALGAVDLLHLIDQVLLHRTRAEDTQHLLRVDGAGHELLTDCHVVPIGHQQAGTLADRVGDLLRPVVGGDHQLANAFAVIDADPAGDLTDRSLTLGGTCLEQLGDTRQTLSYVLGADRTTGVEGTHRQLSTRLTDRLGGDDTHRLTDVDQLPGGQAAPVAGGAGTDSGLTGQHRADLELGDLSLGELGDQHIADVVTVLAQHLAIGRGDLAGEGTTVDGGLDRVGQLGVPGGGVLKDRQGQTAFGTAVVLPDNHVLGDVYQPSGQVTGVSGPQCRIGQTLTSTVGGDEVLQHRQPVTVVGLDRPRDDLTLRVGHQPTHTGDLPHLHPVTGCAGGHHLQHRVVLREVVPHRTVHLVGGLGPDVDELLTALVVGDQTPVVLTLDLTGPRLVPIQDLGLVRGRDHIGYRDRDTAAGGPPEAGLLERIQARRDRKSVG